MEMLKPLRGTFATGLEVDNLPCTFVKHKAGISPGTIHTCTVCGLSGGNPIEILSLCKSNVNTQLDLPLETSACDPCPGSGTSPRQTRRSALLKKLKWL